MTGKARAAIKNWKAALAKADEVNGILSRAEEQLRGVLAARQPAAREVVEEGMRIWLRENHRYAEEEEPVQVMMRQFEPPDESAGVHGRRSARPRSRAPM